MLESGILVFFSEEAIADRQGFNLGSHEAAEGVFRCADDRFAADIEAGIDDHRAAGRMFEGFNQIVIARVGVLMGCLDPRRIVHVGHRRNVGAWHIEFRDTE